MESLNELRTRIVQQIHDSHLIGHPGREGTISTVARRFYWPLMQQIFDGSYETATCGRTKVWREHKHKRRLLQPLPVPDQFGRDLQMDFITNLPLSKGYQHLWVVHDRLCKEIFLEPMKTMNARECAVRFTWFYARYHWWPKIIVSDRGTNWTSDFWRHLCKLLGIKQCLSTAYHPQTDGGTERINTEIEVFLRAYVNQNQDDWRDWCPAAQMALNGRPSAGIEMSVFFATHSYEPPSTIPLSEEEQPPSNSS